jgi:predicted CoA-binding protein
MAKEEIKIKIKFSKNGTEVGCQEILEKNYGKVKKQLEQLGYTVIVVR